MTTARDRSPGAPTTSTGPVTVTMGNKFGGEGNSQPERMDWMDRSRAEFNRLNAPALTVDHVVLNTTDALVAALAAGTGPDVAHASGAFFSDLADKKQWVEIGPYVKRDMVDMNRWYLQEEVLYRNGKHYAMPFSTPPAGSRPRPSTSRPRWSRSSTPARSTSTSTGTSGTPSSSRSSRRPSEARPA